MFFDGSAVEDAQYDRLPDGTYTAVVNLVDEIDSKYGDETYFKAEFVITEGQLSGKTFHQNYYVHADSQKKAGFHKGRFKRLCEAVTGKDSIAEPEELYATPFRLVIETKDYNGKPRQEAVGTHPLSSNPGSKVTKETTETGATVTRRSFSPKKKEEETKEVEEIPF